MCKLLLSKIWTALWDYAGGIPSPNHSTVERVLKLVATFLAVIFGFVFVVTYFTYVMNIQGEVNLYEIITQDIGLKEQETLPFPVVVLCPQSPLYRIGFLDCWWGDSDEKLNDTSCKNDKPDTIDLGVNKRTCFIWNNRTDPYHATSAKNPFKQTRWHLSFNYTGFSNASRYISPLLLVVDVIDVENYSNTAWWDNSLQILLRQGSFTRVYLEKQTTIISEGLIDQFFEVSRQVDYSPIISDANLPPGRPSNYMEVEFRYRTLISRRYFKRRKWPLETLIKDAGGYLASAYAAGGVLFWILLIFNSCCECSCRRCQSDQERNQYDPIIL